MSLIPTLKNFVNIEDTIWVIGKLCFLLSMIAASRAGLVYFEEEKLKLPTLDLELDSNDINGGEKTKLSDFAVVAKRNIFGEKKKKEPSATPVTKKTDAVELKLVGVHYQTTAASLAMIEFTKRNEQDVFQKGDVVFEEGIKLLEISRDSVKVDRHGEIVVLKLDTGGAKSKDSEGEEDGEEEEEENVSVTEEELNKALNNLPELLSQARAVPFFRNGQSIGMRLFAIRQGSLYEKIGLRNGDIVKVVNGNSIGDPSQALKLFEQLRSEKEVDVVLERAGADKRINYSID